MGFWPIAPFGTSTVLRGLDARRITKKLPTKIMNRIAQIDPNTTTGKARQLLDEVQHKMGGVPNLFRVFGNSPAALEAYLLYSRALNAGALSAREREQIALVVAEINDCHYCRSAHVVQGSQAGLNPRQITDARNVAATDQHTAALLNLARSIVVQRGNLSEAEFQAARAGKLTDSEIIETVANVGLNILTNYVNQVAKTVVDFPEANAVEFPSMTTVNKSRAY
jgi:uncharacterized peroxidase-related enzyme